MQGRALRLYNDLTGDIASVMETNGITTTSQLDQIGKGLFGDKFLGSFPRDDIPLDAMKPGDMVIINTDTSTQPGQHWMPMARGVISKHSYYYHDPFAKYHLKFNPRVKMGQQGTGTTPTLVESDSSDQEQSFKEENCGQRALAWLLVFQHCGEKNASSI